MIKKSRELKEISQINLAHQLGISKSYLSKLEDNSGRYSKNPSLELICMLSNKLEICPVEIFIYMSKCCLHCQLKCRLVK